MTKLAYPLEEVLSVKKRRVEKAEKEVLRKEQELQKEKDTLVEVEAARDKVRDHRDAKMTQMLKALDEGTTSPEVLQMRGYIKVVKVKLAEEEQKVKAQEEQVDIAKKNLEVAKQELAMRRKEVEKIEQHKEIWLKEAKKELEIEEGREQDEMGSVMFLTRRLRE